jgi:tetratricopeptide (TPR) repeat protein
MIRRGDLAATRPIYDRFLREAELVGFAGQVLWVRAQESSVRFVGGDWDDALATVDALIAEIESGNPHYLESNVRETRALIRHARGNTPGAIADAERAVDVSRESKDPQSIVPALGTVAGVYAREGRGDLARAAIDEALAVARPLERHHYSEAITLLWPTLDLGLSTELVEIFDRGEDTDPWTKAAIAAWRGDLAAAAAVFERFGALWFEAEIRMRIAERDGDQTELQRASATVKRCSRRRLDLRTLGAWPSSSPPTSARSSPETSCSTASPSASNAATASRCRGRTAPARRRCSGFSPARRRSTAASSRSRRGRGSRCTTSDRRSSRT